MLSPILSVVSMCVTCAYIHDKRDFSQRSLAYWDLNILGYVNLLQFLMEVKPAHFPCQSSTVGMLWTRQTAWSAEWQLSREVTWQPIISQECLFSGICHIFSLSLHHSILKWEKKDRNADIFFHKMNIYNSCTPLIPESLRTITGILNYCIRKYFLDWKRWNILNS